MHHQTDHYHISVVIFIIMPGLILFLMSPAPPGVSSPCCASIHTRLGAQPHLHMPMLRMLDAKGFTDSTKNSADMVLKSDKYHIV